MKKLLTLTLLAIMVLGASAFATSTRTTVMGETNNVLLDEANIWLYPSRINMYPNIAIGEVGYYDYYYEGYYGDLAQLGIHWKFNEKNPWILGTYLSQDAFTGGTGMGQLGLSYETLPFRYPSFDMWDAGWFEWPYTPTYNEGNQRITLFYGRKLGTNPFGFRLSKFHSSYKEEGTEKENYSLGEYDFAFGLTDAAGKWDVSAGLNMLTWTNKNNNGSDVTKPKGNMLFYAQGRMFKQINPQWTIVPNAGLMFGSYKAEFYDGGSPTNTLLGSESYKTTTFWAGLGGNYTPAANVLAVIEGGIGFNSSKVEDKPVVGTTTAYKMTFMTLPYIKIGFEGKVFDWMDLRAGANSYWHRAKEDYDPNPGGDKYKYNYPDNATYLGTGMHFGNFHIDTYTHPELLLNGFNFISGNTTSDLNAKVSILYEFK